MRADAQRLPQEPATKEQAEKQKPGTSASPSRGLGGMTALDLREHAPRGPRETLLGFYFLPRTVDKLRAELPGGNPGSYVNEERGFSAYIVRRLGLDMGEFRQAVADCADETALQMARSEDRSFGGAGVERQVRNVRGGPDVARRSKAGSPAPSSDGGAPGTLQDSRHSRSG